MSVSNYRELADHAGHAVAVVIYGGDANAAVECEDCSVVLVDFDRFPGIHAAPAPTPEPGTGDEFFPGPEVPALYATEPIDTGDKIMYAHYSCAGGDWWVAEYDPDTGDAFGFAHLIEGEWGDFNLRELRHLRLIDGGRVERDTAFTPTRFADLPASARTR